MTTTKTMANAGPSPRPVSVRGLGLCLPRSAALTAALIEPTAVEVSAEQLEAIRTRLIVEVRALTERISEYEPLDIRPYEVANAFRRRDLRAAPGSEPSAKFVPTPARCKRAVGLAAVKRCARGTASTPHTAVCEVLDAAVEDVSLADRCVGAPRPEWWAEWYAGLVPAARAVVRAEAVTWATQLWNSLDWSRLERPPIIGGPDDRWKFPGCPGLVLRGGAEVRVWAGSRQSLFVLGTSFPTAASRTELACRALVATLVRGERSTPGRVVGFWPASGVVRICDVDESLLSDAASAVVSAVGAYLSSANASSVSATTATKSSQGPIASDRSTRKARRGQSRAARSASATSSLGSARPSTIG
jgi:hypothetical protein